MSSLWKGGRGADLTVVCGPITLKVHSILVCERSKFFAASCKDGFMVRPDSMSYVWSAY